MADALNLLRSELEGQVKSFHRDLSKLQSYRTGKESLHIKRVRIESYRSKLAKAWFEYYRIISLSTLLDAVTVGKIFSFLLDDVKVFLLSGIYKPESPEIQSSPFLRSANTDFKTAKSISDVSDAEEENPPSPKSSISEQLNATNIPDDSLSPKGLFQCLLSYDRQAKKLSLSPTADDILSAITNLLELITKSFNDISLPIQHSLQHTVKFFKPLSMFSDEVKFEFFPSESVDGGALTYDCLVPTVAEELNICKPFFVKIFTMSNVPETLRICPHWIPPSSIEFLQGKTMLLNIATK